MDHESKQANKQTKQNKTGLVVPLGSIQINSTHEINKSRNKSRNQEIKKSRNREIKNLNWCPAIWEIPLLRGVVVLGGRADPTWEQQTTGIQRFNERRFTEIGSLILAGG
jgi:hypothetical protein